MILDEIEKQIDESYTKHNYSKLSRLIDKYFSQNNFYKKQGINLMLDLEFAKLEFYKGELLFEDYMKRNILPTNNLDTFISYIKSIVKERNQLTDIYSGVDQYGDIEWWSRALYRLGQLNEHLFEILQNGIGQFAPNLDEIKSKAFTKAMQKNYIQPIYKEMIRYFQAGNTLYAHHGLRNKWTSDSRKKLIEFDIIKITYVKIDTTYFSNKEWVNKENPKPDWFETNFNDLLWNNSSEISSDTINTFKLADNSQCKVIWNARDSAGIYYFRNKFSCPDSVQQGSLLLEVQKVFTVYLNGLKIEKSNESIQKNEYFTKYYLTEYFSPGNNVIAIKVYANDQKIGLCAKIHVSGFKKVVGE